MDFGREPELIVPDSAMYKVTTPGVKQLHILQWISHVSCHMDASMELVHCDYFKPGALSF